MNLGVLAMIAFTALPACAAKQSTTAPPAAAGAPAAPQALPPGFQAEYTGQNQPTITVNNEFQTVQYLFLDRTFLGAVPVGGAATFNVNAGPHEFLASDSMNPDDNPVKQDVAIEVGYAYTFRIYVIPQ